MCTLTDGEMIERMRNGDETGLEALLRQHGPHVKGCLRLQSGLRPEDEALEDAVQDAGLALFQAAGRLATVGNLPGYFYQTAKRKLFSALRARRGTPQPWEGAEAQLAHRESADGDPAEQPSEFLDRLAVALQSLTTAERDLVGLDTATGGNLSADELAQLLGIKPDSVYTLRRRAKQRLAGFLAQWDEEQQRSRRRGPDPDGSPREDSKDLEGGLQGPDNGGVR